MLCSVYDAIVRATAVQGTAESEQLSRVTFFRFDFSITNEDSVRRHKVEIAREIKVVLILMIFDVGRKHNLSLRKDLLGDMDDREVHKQKMKDRFYIIYGKRICINLIILGMLFGSLYGIYETVLRYSEGSTTER